MKRIKALILALAAWCPALAFAQEARWVFGGASGGASDLVTVDLALVAGK